MLSRRLFCVGSVIAALCGVLASGQNTPSVAAQQLYLLAATPIDVCFVPATLYRANGGKLKTVREVVPRDEGVSAIHAWGNAIFLTHPLYVGSPRAVSIIHTDAPERVDDVLFNSDAWTPTHSGSSAATAYVALAEPRASSIDLLLPISKDFSHPTDTTLVSVSGDLTASGPRVQSNNWNEYAVLRREGDPGGPVPAQGLIGAVSDDKLVFPPAFGHPVVIDTLSPEVREAANGTTFHYFLIIAATPRYLLIRLEYSPEDRSSGEVGNSQEMFIHDRTNNSWTTVQIEGNESRSRIFDPWLATVVGMLDDPSHERPVPTPDLRRKFATDRLPNVQEAYAYQGGTGLPGILLLQNIEDGRKIRIETGQIDSEILWVGNGTVLYRVNDTIYQARIVGSQIQNSRVLVKDDDVPEVHWVFWGR